MFIPASYRVRPTSPLQDWLRSTGPRLTTSSAGLSHPGKTQASEQKPTTQCHFEENHRQIEPGRAYRRGEVGENDESESTDYAPCRRDPTEGSQCFRDVP